VTVKDGVPIHIEGNLNSLTRGTMCAKGLYNGPCGGTNKGNCEISNEQPCAWFKIYERLKGQNRLDSIRKINTVRGWNDQIPRNLIQPGYKKPETTTK
jgi:hypothetical protein